MPVGCIVIAVAVVCTGFGFPGGRGAAPGAAAICRGGRAGRVALSVDRGRAQVTGLVGVGVVLLVLVRPCRTIARHEETDSPGGQA